MGQQPLITPLYKRDNLQLPFFDNKHRVFMKSVESFTENTYMPDAERDDLDKACINLVRELGRSELLRACIPQQFGGLSESIESRYLSIAREGLAYRCGLADFSFAMQGLGSGPITLAGSPELKQRLLPNVLQGKLIPAFALSEKNAGSDVSAMTTYAIEDGNAYVINGEKTWISNGGIADFYTLFARTGTTEDKHNISAFIVYPDDPGFQVTQRLDIMAPHPLATIQFTDMRIPKNRLLGSIGQGFKLAMQTLDIFRISVAGAALGFARRAIDEAILHSQSRKLFNGKLSDLQMTQSTLADMAALMDSATLVTYRAAWHKDVLSTSANNVAALAKLVATENAQQIIDKALQLFGARGVQKGEIMESLYREIRALRIYEGATEIQKIIIARHLMQ